MKQGRVVLMAAQNANAALPAVRPPTASPRPPACVSSWHILANHHAPFPACHLRSWKRSAGNPREGPSSRGSCSCHCFVVLAVPAPDLPPKPPFMGHADCRYHNDRPLVPASTQPRPGRHATILVTCDVGPSQPPPGPIACLLGVPVIGAVTDESEGTLMAIADGLGFLQPQSHASETDGKRPVHNVCFVRRQG